MVIVVMSGDIRLASGLARPLAAELGWPVVDASASVTATRDAVAHAQGRREPTVVITECLNAQQRHAVADGRLQVRWVLRDESAAMAGWNHPDAVMHVGTQADPEPAIQMIRREFGV